MVGPVGRRLWYVLSRFGANKVFIGVGVWVDIAKKST
jgi:hypothetical protein